MLSQTTTEAMLSAAYVENYLDCVENLPNDLQRHLSRMRELDVTYRECVRDAQAHLSVCIGSNIEEKRRGRAAARLQASLVAAQEIGDEKLQVVQVLQDLIDNKQRALDADHKKLVSCLEVNTNGSGSNGNGNKKEPTPPVEPIEKESPPPQQTTPVPTPPDRSIEKEKEKIEKDKSGVCSLNEQADVRERRKKRQKSPAKSRSSSTSSSAVSKKIGRPATKRRHRQSRERWSKRARRARNNAGANTDGADSSERDSERQTSTHTHKKGIGKKKKRKARQAAQRSETPPEETDAIDPDEPRYCLCDQISFGEMILCDNDLCPIEWFHFSCVSLTTKPKGKWFCPKCRGDRPNVMKPKGQFLKELERYNKEKEEKA